MFFQRDHSVTSAEHEQLEEYFEQVIVRGAVVRSTFEGINQALGEVDQDLARRHNDKCAHGSSADDQQLIVMQERSQMAAAPGETAKNATDNYQGTNDNNHDDLLLRLG